MGGRYPINDMQDAFLAAYSLCGKRYKAAEAVGITRRMHSEWMRKDPEYPEKFREAHEEWLERVEEDARVWACEGVEEQHYENGVLVKVVKKRNPTVLLAILNAELPEKYRGRQSIEHSGPAGGPISIGGIESYTDEQLERIIADGDETATDAAGSGDGASEAAQGESVRGE